MITNAKWCDYTVARDYGLRPRHVQLLAGAAKGMQNAEIADPSLTRDQQLMLVRRRLAELQALLDGSGEHLRAVS